MKSSRSTHKGLFKLVKAEHFLYVTTAAFFFIFAWWFAGLHYISRYGEGGSSAKAPTGSQQFYKSLNIEQARQADFSSPAIKKNTDLGTIAGVRHVIFSFAVPHDNLTENGLMTLPTANAPPGGYPVIILCHGYADPYYYSTEKAYVGDMEFYSQRGFAVLKPDYRGQGLSIPDGQPEGSNYSMAYNTDVLSLVGAIKNTSYLDKNHINLWGHSMGAYIALRASVVSKDIKSAILLSGPVGNIQDIFDSYVAIQDTANAVAANIRLDVIDQYGTPLTNPGYWYHVSPLNYLKDTNTFFQIHVGSQDQTVPPKLSAELDAALTKAGKEHGYYVYQGGRHGLVPERQLILERSLSVLSK